MQESCTATKRSVGSKLCTAMCYKQTFLVNPQSRERRKYVWTEGRLAVVTTYEIEVQTQHVPCLPGDMFAGIHSLASLPLTAKQRRREQNSSQHLGKLS